MNYSTFIPVGFSPFLAFILVLAIIPLARKIAIHIGLTDKPGGRKQHEDEVPLIGGLIIFPVFIGLGLLSGFSLSAYWPLIAALGLLLITGAIDDKFHLGAWLRFGVQIFAASLVVLAGGAQLEHLGNLFGFGHFELGFMAAPFSIIALTLLINAVNLMDGLDGLAAGKSAVMIFWLMLACGVAGNAENFLALSILLGAVMGFLFYNMRHPFRKKASVFLGDAGSLCLGLAIGWYCIHLAQDPDPAVVPITIAWIIALPIIDACGQFYRRVKEGRHPFDPDRGHFHYHFIHAGLSVSQSTWLILLWVFVLGGIGYLGVYFGVPEPVLTIFWIGLLFSHMAMSYRPQRFIEMLMRFHKKKAEHSLAPPEV
jgi:UDP-GlcNAc:undecaprenyl-phosphate GlcNAc-1-phosphate transferase